MVIISLNNQKGGVAKTTTAVNLSAGLSKKHKVLMVDLDPQSNLTYNFKIDETETSICNLFRGEKYNIIEISKNLHLIPSSLDFIGMVHEIASKLSRETILKKQLKKYEKDYDYCIIDCPSDINLITINALTCADYVIIPVEAGAYGMKGIELLIDNITEIKDSVNDDLAIMGVLITKLNIRLKLSKNILQKFIDKGWKAALFKTVIRENTAIGNSQEARQTIFEYDPKSKAAEDYQDFVKEVLVKIKNT